LFSAVLLLLSGTAVLSQSGGSKGSGDSGGEKPYGGNVFRQDEMNQQLDPAGTSPYQTGLSLLKDQKYGEAIPHLNAAVARKPGDAGAWFYLGYAHQEFAGTLPQAQQDDELDTAMRNYRHALMLDPDIKAAHQYLGLLLLKKHDADAAASQASALARLCPGGCDERKELDAAIAKTAPAAQR
jgi:tetratricopeptide (TPR) repeat protein